MKCPYCSAATRVLSTRDDARRRQCSAGCRFNTTEVPQTVLRAIGRRVLAEAAAAMVRGAKRRQRRAQVEQLLAQGWKPAAIAHHVGLTETRVRQIRGACRA